MVRQCLCLSCVHACVRLCVCRKCVSVWEKLNVCVCVCGFRFCVRQVFLSLGGWVVWCCVCVFGQMCCVFFGVVVVCVCVCVCVYECVCVCVCVAGSDGHAL